MGMARVATPKPFGMSAFLQLIAILRYTSGRVYCRLLVFTVAGQFPRLEVLFPHYVPHVQRGLSLGLLRPPLYSVTLHLLA